jgi:hypothetical protein
MTQLATKKQAELRSGQCSHHLKLSRQIPRDILRSKLKKILHELWLLGCTLEECKECAVWYTIPSGDSTGV